jgi:hypothetical protein
MASAIAPVSSPCGTLSDFVLKGPLRPVMRPQSRSARPRERPPSLRRAFKFKRGTTALQLMPKYQLKLQSYSGHQDDSTISQSDEKKGQGQIQNTAHMYAALSPCICAYAAYSADFLQLVRRLA